MPRARWNLLALAMAAALGLQGCREALDPVTSTPTMRVATETAPLVPRLIAPQATDPEINWIPTVDPQFNHHYVWFDASGPSNGKLFVFLPGSHTQLSPRPRCCQLVQQEAGRLGYHVIGLVYPTNIGVNLVCAGSADLECNEKVRLEFIDGVDRSALVDVSRANSIENRLTKLLRYLDAQFPTEGWSRFLHKGDLKWSQIAVGGHSSGAAQAALIGKIRHVNRVVMLAGPPDVGGPEEPAAWVSIGETPAAKHFELLHQRDPRNAAIFANIDALELDRFGDPVAPELSEPPYGGTHILITDLEPRGGYGADNPHRSVAADAWTPRAADDTPRLRDAWRYMLGDHENAAGARTGTPR